MFNLQFWFKKWTFFVECLEIVNYILIYQYKALKLNGKPSITTNLNQLAENYQLAKHYQLAIQGNWLARDRCVLK